MPAGQASAATRVALEYEPPIPHVEPAGAFTLAVDAAQGESNRLSVLRDARGFVVRAGAGQALAPGERCVAVTASEVQCAPTDAASHLSVFVATRDRADTVVLGQLPGVDLAEVVAGTGDDVVGGQAGADLFYGGAGKDVLAGFDGEDRLDGGHGRDVLDGGPGGDFVLYGSRKEGVTVDLRTGRGGAAGESDVLRNFENASGGHGSDRLFGDAGPNVLYGGLDGDDIGRGNAGDDTLTLRRPFGGGGDDTIDGKFADCGPGFDLVNRQRFYPPGPYGRGCERVRSYFYSVARARLDGHRLRLDFTCPVRSCSGRLVVRDRRGRLGVRHYSMRGESFGGRPRVPIAIPLERRPAGRRPELVIVGQAFAHDSFRVRLR